MELLTKFEKEALNKLLEGDDPVLAALRKQANDIVVSSREYTGVGFYTNFEYKSPVVPIHEILDVKERFVIHDLCAKCSLLENGAGFNLFVVGGVIKCLEGFALVDNWPDEIPQNSTDWHFYYCAGERKINKLKDMWSNN